MTNILAFNTPVLISSVKGLKVQAKGQSVCFEAIADIFVAFNQFNLNCFNIFDQIIIIIFKLLSTFLTLNFLKPTDIKSN